MPYDELDRLIRTEYNSGRYITYAYSAEGQISRIAYGDGSSAKGSYDFEYDSLGRLIRSVEYDGSGAVKQRTEHLYDAYNRLSSQSWILGDTPYTESYTYSDGEDGDGSITKMTTATGDTISYTYDALKRLQKTITADEEGKTLFTTAYAFRTVSGNQTSSQIEYRNVYIGTNDTILEGKKYTYDALGNITGIYESTDLFRQLVAYTYDSQNQLLSETYYTYSGTSTTPATTNVYSYRRLRGLETMENKTRGFEAELSNTKSFRISDILNGIPLDDYQFLIPSCMVYPDSLAVDVAKVLSLAEFFRFSMQEYYTLELSVYIFPHRTVVHPIGDYQEFQNSPCICGILYYDCAYLEVYVKSQEWLEQIKRNVEGMQPLMLEFITDLSDGRREFF